MFIAIINYGMGNLRSVEKGFESVGSRAVITKDPAQIKEASGVVLPGVGAFDAAVRELRTGQLDQAIYETVEKGKPFLGVCLGLQLLFSESEEGREKGLGLIPGKVKKFQVPSSKFKVPHMGWNQIKIVLPSPILDGVPDESWMYFVHSYFPEPKDKGMSSTLTEHEIEFASSIWKGNLFGTQFHPEKSGEFGLKILENFGKLCSK